MPLLEQRRQSPAAFAGKYKSLIHNFAPVWNQATRSWLLVWSVCHLAGFVTGGAMGIKTLTLLELPPWLSFLENDPVLLTRVSGGTLLAFPWVGRKWTPILYLLVLILGVLSGQAAQQELKERKSAWAPDVVSRSQASEIRGAGLFRTTGWAVELSSDRWKTPAVVLGWKAKNGTAGTNFETGAGPVLAVEQGEGIYLSGQGEVPKPGVVISGLATVRIPRSGDLPGSFDYRQYLAGRHLRWAGRLERIDLAGAEPWPIVELLDRFRMSILRAIEDLFPRREAQLAAAVLLGVRTRESRMSALSFADLGLAHLFAVSGLHVGILVGILILPTHVLALPAKGRFLVLLMFLPFYCLLTGLPGSVVRAAGLGLLASGAMVFGRRRQPLALLGFLFWSTTWLDPTQVLDAGVRLSYLAAGGILATLSLTSLDPSGKGIRSHLLLALLVSLSAQWFTLSQAALSFGRFSLLSPLANLVAVPVFGFGVWAIVLALLTAGWWPWASQAIAAVGWLLLRALTGLVAWTSQTSGGLNMGTPAPNLIQGLVWGLLTLGGLILLWSGQRGRLSNRAVALGVVTILLSGHGVFAYRGFIGKQPEKVQVWQFNVAQGDCGLVSFPDGWHGLIDTGGVFSFNQNPPDGHLNRLVIPFLKRHWVNELQAVVLSHGHLDHTGGVAGLAQALPVQEWIGGGDVVEDLSWVDLSPPLEKTEEPRLLHCWNDWRLEIIHPEGPIPSEFHENDHSLVAVLWQGEQAKMVWSGDLETKGERYLLEQGIVPGAVQVWKAGHHGSNTSGSQAWLDHLDPELILISCGVGNRYGHPNHGWYVVRGDTIATLRTDLHGSIKLQWSLGGELKWDLPAGFKATDFLPQG